MRFSDIREAYETQLASLSSPPTENSRRVQESALRTTLLRQVQEHVGCTLAEAKVRLESDDIGPLLAQTVAAAERHAATQGDASSRNGVSAVQRYLRVAFPGRFHRHSTTGGSLTVSEGWRPVVEAAKGLGRNREVAAQFVWNLSLFAKAMFAAHVESPASLPGRTTVEDILRQAGYDERRIGAMLSAYRLAKQRLQETGQHLDAVSMQRRTRATERSLRSLPREHFTQGGGLPLGRQPSDLTAAQLLPLICPFIAEDLDEWRAKRGAEFRPRSHQTAFYATCHVVSELAKHPELLRNCTWPDGEHALRPIPALHELRMWHLAELRVPSGAPVADIDDTAAARAFMGGEALPVPSTSLLLAALDIYAQALRSRAPASGVVYSGWLRACYGYVAFVLRSHLSVALSGTTRWTRISETLSAEAKTMAAANGQHARGVTKDKLFLAQHLNLAQVVCIGLPRMAKRVRLLRAELERAEATAPLQHGGVWRKRIGSARLDYLRALEGYVVVATMVADPVRLKNHRYGLVGAHGEYRIVLHQDATRSQAIHKIESVFSNDGGANPAAALKQARRKLLRQWTWLKTLIDHELLRDYLVEVRWPRIVAAGVLKDGQGNPVTMASPLVWEEMTRGAGLPLFISPEPRRGDLTHRNLGPIFVRAFRRMLQQTFKLSVPDVRGRGSSQWRGLMSPHVVRLLWSSYWGGIRGEHGPVLRDGHQLSGWAIAMHATTDTRRVLERDYTVVSEWARNAQRTSATAAKGDLVAASQLWKHPHAFDALMDRTYCDGNTVDWDNEQVPLPPGIAPLRSMRLGDDA